MNKERFTKLALMTRSLYVKDDAVRVAIELGWIDVAKQLLVRNPTMSYEDQPLPTSIPSILSQFHDSPKLRKQQGRWLLKMALLDAVRNDKVEAFNLLAPVVGVDFTDINGRDIVENVTSSQMDLSTKKKWLDLMIKYIDRKVSCVRLENAVHHYAKLGLAEHILSLLDSLFSTYKGVSYPVIGTLVFAILDGRGAVARRIIDGHKRAAIPIFRTAMYAAVDAEDMDMVSYLYWNLCHSFSLKAYGEKQACELRNFLMRNNQMGFYHSIIDRKC